MSVTCLARTNAKQQDTEWDAYGDFLQKADNETHTIRNVHHNVGQILPTPPLSFQEFPVFLFQRTTAMAPEAESVAISFLRYARKKQNANSAIKS